MKLATAVGAVCTGLALCLTACAPGGGAAPTPSVSSAPATPLLGYDLVPHDTNGDGVITVGFSQANTDTPWLQANTQSYKDYFVPANGFNLVLDDAGGDAAKQLSDVTNLIQQGVEAIVINPVSGDGWQPVLQQAKAAGIPVVIVNQPLTVSDDSYLSYFGNDPQGEGRRAVSWLQNYLAVNHVAGPVNIVHMQATAGSAEQAGRSQALTDAAAGNGWSIVTTLSGGSSHDLAQQAMAAFLKQKKAFDVVYSEDDDMTSGVVDALKAAGLDPAGYVIISFGGDKQAVQMVVDGTVSVIAQCDPATGPQVGALLTMAGSGQPIAKVTYAREGTIDKTNAATALATAYG